MKLIELTKFNDYGEYPVFINPDRITYIEPMIGQREENTRINIIGKENGILVLEEYKEVFEKIEVQVV